ncbi:MAG: DUF3783 domain-containing protein [Clostridia bacterium]|nr:DUF3783 domain-containing protein [Clostridia bacterium]
MKKQILVYNLSDAQISALRVQLKPLGCTVRKVIEKEYSLPIGALAGLNGFVYKKTAKPSQLIRTSFAVICGYSGFALDAVTAAFDRGGVSGVVKAVLTETNAQWDSITLYNEVMREHNYMQNKNRPD